jgi:hypothetical protein
MTAATASPATGAIRWSATPTFGGAGALCGGALQREWRGLGRATGRVPRGRDRRGDGVSGGCRPPRRTRVPITSHFGGW